MSMSDSQNARSTASLHLSRLGFSLLEMLIVVAVIGVMATIGIVFYGRNHRDVVLKVRDQRNAQEITALVMGAQAAGASVVVPDDLQATVRGLIEGRQGTSGTFKGKTFKLAHLTDDEIQGALRFIKWQDGLPAYLPAPK